MTKTERVKAYGYRECVTEMCANCKHYHPHFVYDSNISEEFLVTTLGHCSYPRMKLRKQYDACNYFESVWAGKGD